MNIMLMLMYTFILSFESDDIFHYAICVSDETFISL